MPAERISKRLARAGVCSRREAETLIQQGRVRVNGDIITSPALNVEATDKIHVDDEPIKLPDIARLWKYHKPRGLICSTVDDKNRPTIFADLENHAPHLPRLMSVGRLDYNSEGLLLLTNSGTLSRHLELPSTGWIRRYKVRVLGRPKTDTLKKLKDGITVEGVVYGSIEATVDTQKEEGANVWLIIKLKEGKNREIRKVMEHVGHPVNRLIRLSYGPFQLGKLNKHEIEEIPESVLKDQFGSAWTTF